MISHHQKAAVVKFDIKYRQPGVSGLTTFASANQLLLSGENWSRPADENWMDSRGCFFGSNVEGPVFFNHGRTFPPEDEDQGSQPSLQIDTRCELDLFDPTTGNRKSGALMVWVCKVLAEREQVANHNESHGELAIDVDNKLGSPLMQTMDSFTPESTVSPSSPGSLNSFAQQGVDLERLSTRTSTREL